MEFRVLGVVEALDDGLAVSLGGPKQRSVLAMLLLEPNRSVSTDRLVDGLWGDDPPQHPAATLQVYVSNLRKVAGARSQPACRAVGAADPAARLPARRRSRAGRPLPVRTAGRPRSHAAVQGCVAGAAVLFREALARWREAPLADLANEPLARVRGADGSRRHGRGRSKTGSTSSSRSAGTWSCSPSWRRSWARNPYRERLRRQLMLALYRAGRQADALAAYQAARQTLVEELGLEPSRELREMEAAILVHEPALAQAATAPIEAEDVARVLRRH